MKLATLKVTMRIADTVRHGPRASRPRLQEPGPSGCTQLEQQGR